MPRRCSPSQVMVSSRSFAASVVSALRVLGPSVSQAEVPDVIEQLIEVYLERRESEEELFIDVVRRIGIEPFKDYVYGSDHQARASRRRQLAAA